MRDAGVPGPALETFEDRCQKDLFRRRAHAAHAGQDSAAALRDLDVRRSARAHLELVLARAGEDRVRVRVDEPRDDRAVARVELARRAKARP